VTRGQEVSATEKASHYFGQVRPEWTTVKFEIYATTKTTTLHTTERGCTRLAKIVIDTKDPFRDTSTAETDSQEALSTGLTQIQKGGTVADIPEVREKKVLVRGEFIFRNMYEYVLYTHLNIYLNILNAYIYT
jgi:hypothetical protein